MVLLNPLMAGRLYRFGFQIAIAGQDDRYDLGFGHAHMICGLTSVSLSRGGLMHHCHGLQLVQGF
jgi:hypothetical protein